MPESEEAWRARIEDRLARLEDRFKEPTPSLASPQKTTSISEFVRSKNPKTEVDFLVTVIGYSEAFDHAPHSTTESVKESFRRIKQPLPKNLADVLYKAINRSLVMEVPNPEDGTARAFQLTATGEKYIAELKPESK